MPGLVCSLCEKDQREVVVFLRDRKGGICDECVELAVRIVEDQRAKRLAATADDSSAVDSEAP